MTALDRMPANDLADRIVVGPTGYSVDGDEESATEVRRLACHYRSDFPSTDPALAHSLPVAAI